MDWNWRGGRGGFSRGGRGGGRGFWRGPRGGSQFQGGHNRDFNRGAWRGGGHRNYDNNSKPQWERRPRREQPTIQLSEDTIIGVTEYIMGHKGFNGIIKSRYSDFQVSEINEQGVVAKLTDVKPPLPPGEEVVVQDEELLFSKYNLEILPMETWDQIHKVATAGGGKGLDKVDIDATDITKTKRTMIKGAVRKAFGTALVCSTVNIGDKNWLRFERYREGLRVDNRPKWPYQGDFMYFIVHKENCDTMDAATRIAERLNIKPKALGYAETKDSCAKTSQWFSLRKVHPQKVAAACENLTDIRVGNYEIKMKNLKLGIVKGNKFRIALRNVTADDEVVSQACEQLKEKGFLNYYELPRFGARKDIPPYDIALKLMQGKFKEAVDGILEERDGMKKKLSLRQFQKLPRNTRLLYLRSYQFLIWNRAASERVRRLGLTPAVGDIVSLDNTEDICKLEDEEDDDDEDSESREDAQNGEQSKTSIKQEKKQISIKILTQEDVDSGKYTLCDIILPLPGEIIQYPPNMKDYYKELLTKDGLTLDMKDRQFKSYQMPGGYRHLVVRPTDVSWSTVRYTEPSADLILSDWDELQGVKLSGIVEDGKYKAVLLNMTLPAFCYATMALRELLRK
ncbi:tRNA pseudouridine synthase D (TruD) domain-containing protein [Phthorimaea operculella]|nr:tRNA pseudouridine synthase D (TruD) domain-containing protein [Phthorimaea operculella]